MATQKRSREELLEALDARHFVAIRRAPGGPVPEAIRPALDLAEADLAETERWIEEKSTAPAAYPEANPKRLQQIACGLRRPTLAPRRGLCLQVS